MSNLKIYPDPILRKKAQPVKRMDKDILKVLDQMLEIMQRSKGIGLAAPQIGISKQLIVVDVGEGAYKLINPKVTLKRGRRIMEEGCLSFPELAVKVCRADKIKLEALNEKGEKIVIDAGGILSTCLQHELDHLKGKLIIDYVAWPKRWFLHKQLKQRKCVL